MESSDREVLACALGWLEGGSSVILVTVAQTWGSAPRPRGALLAVNPDGRWVGSVSGGCVEHDLVRRLREAPPIAGGAPQIHRYGVSGEDARRFGLPCGGRLELVAERLEDAQSARVLLQALDERHPVVRRLCLESGAISLAPADSQSAFRYEAKALERVFGAQWRLLLIGAGQIAAFVSQMALALDYRVVICEPRARLHESWRLPGVEIDARMPDDVVPDLVRDRHCAVVALTHDPRLDDLALVEALHSPAAYVGALGSRASNTKRRARLTWLGVSEQALARLHAPVGLPIGGNLPAEIAVAIVAELTAERHGVRLAAIAPPVSGTPIACTP